MTPEQAVETVNGTIFKPGWSFRARHSGYGEIHVDLLIRTVDTSYTDDQGRFTVPLTTAVSDYVRVHDLDEAGLLAELLDIAARADEHENREFLKVRRSGRWHAPLHPHTTEGEMAWYSHRLAKARAGARR